MNVLSKNVSPFLDMCVYSVCCKKAVLINFSKCIALLLSDLHPVSLQSEQCHHTMTLQTSFYYN